MKNPKALRRGRRDKEAVRSWTEPAFTLLELLTCVAIVAVLTVLLFATVGRMREGMLNTKCAGNLKQVGNALGAYVADRGGVLPPRNLGVNRTTEPKPEANLRGWPGRLVNLGYSSSVDIFYCPSFTPRSSNVAKTNLRAGGAAETYGMRTWAPAGARGADYLRWSEEEKMLAGIEKPSDFFLVADSYWADWNTQGYGITPGTDKQAVHLRHSRRANALFADGHVEAKDKDYFENLHKVNRQAAYANGNDTIEGGKIYARTDGVE